MFVILKKNMGKKVIFIYRRVIYELMVFEYCKWLLACVSKKIFLSKIAIFKNH